MTEAGLNPRGIGQLKTHRADIVASLLAAMLIVAGGVVAFLFLLWLTSGVAKLPTGSGAVVVLIPGAEGDSRVAVDKVLPPGLDEAVELAEPSLQQSLVTISGAVETVASSPLQDGSSQLQDARAGDMSGDQRLPGPAGSLGGGVPRYERWQLKFQAESQEQYAEQLDYYAIELGCIGGDSRQVDYASGFSQDPKKRSGSSAEENERGRLYFLWRGGVALEKFDRRLLEEAGVKTTSRFVVKFISKSLEAKLAEIEQRHCVSNGKTVQQVAKTVFQSRKVAGGYSFVVVGQVYRQ